MSDIRALARHNDPAAASANNILVSANATRDGALFTAADVRQWALEGRVFVANVGTGTSPTTFNAAYAAAEQDLFVHVPTGTALIPIYISVAFEDTGTAAVQDVLAMVSSTGDAAVTGTALTIYNARTDAPRASGCTATAVVTSNGSDPHAGTFYEFWRAFAGMTEDAFNGSTAFVNPAVHTSSWSLNQSAMTPIVANGGSLSVYASGQAATGFIFAAWAELPSTRIQ